MTFDIETYRKHLPVMKHRLDDELELLPQLMDGIGTEVARKGAKMSAAKNELAQCEARLADSLRDSDQKSTLDAIKAYVLRHPDRTKAWQRYEDARTQHEEWLGLQEAYRQKSYAIKTLAELYCHQYFTLTSTSAGTTMPGDRRPARDRVDASLEADRAEVRKAYERTSARRGLVDDEPAPKPARLPIRRRG